MTPDISLRSSHPSTRLATYLNDHLGGSATGSELARRALANNRANEYGVALEDVVRQIEEDVGALEAVMDRLGVKPDRVKEAMGWTFEKFGRLKLNGQLLGYSPLSRLVELEVLYLGITGTMRLWRALEGSLGERSGFDFGALAERASRQRDVVGDLHLAAAARALGASAPA
jgi:hypothetical protein